MSKEIQISERVKSVGIFLFALVAIELRFYLLYYPIKFYNYLVPPGDDAINHYKMIENILHGKFDTTYPWLFHYIIAAISRVMHINPMTVLLYVTPALVILPSIAIYIFLNKSFNRLIALIGMIICLWTSNYALIAYGDGNYPNIIAGGFFLPLALLYFNESFRERKLLNYLLAALFVGLTILTHHLSLVYLGAVLVVYLIALGIWNKKEKIAENYKRAAIFIIAALVVGIALISTLSLGRVFANALSSLSQGGSFSVGASFLKPIEFSAYASQVGDLVYYGGLICMLSLIFLLGKDKERINKSAVLLVLVWFVVLFVMSRFSQLGLPGRFARETAVPLILSIAISVGYFVEQMKNNWQKYVAMLFLVFILSVNLVQINTGQYQTPNFFTRMIWFSDNDKVAAEALGRISSPDSKIIANPTTPYLPIFAEREVLFPDKDQVPDALDLGSYAKRVSAEYIFIGKKTDTNPDGDVYPFFVDFDERTDRLTKAVENCDPAISDKNFTIYNLQYCKLKTRK